MIFFKKRLEMSPWLLIRLFMPVTLIVPLVSYWFTLYEKIYPGTSAALTAQAVKVSESIYLTNPVFSLVSRQIAVIPWETLPVRLNFFSAVCGAVAVALFYILIARITALLSCEDSGGAMQALPPQIQNNDYDSDIESGDGAAAMLSQNATDSMPEEVLQHNRRTAYSAVLGALGASAVLAFCGPFWFSATRLYPCTFDMMLLFLIMNLIIAYDQEGKLWTLLSSVFFLALCSVESALFLVLLPVGILLLYRSMKLSEQFSMGRVLLCIVCAITGGSLALLILWNAAGYCQNITVLAPRAILSVFKETTVRDVLSWLPRFGWSRILVFFIFPVITAFFVFAYSFRIRKPFLFIVQLLLAALLIPTLINFRLAPWGIVRMISEIPVLSYAILAGITGILTASLHLMREMYIEQLDDELDFYEYRDNPYVCRIGSLLCWPLFLLSLCVPFFSFKDIDPNQGRFTDEISSTIHEQISKKTLILDMPFLKNEILVKARENDSDLNLYQSETLKHGIVSAKYLESIKQSPEFQNFKYRLINAAEISTYSFMREWLALDPKAYTKIAIFSYPGTIRKLGYIAVPEGFFLELLPADREIDSDRLVNKFFEFADSMHPYMFSKSQNEIKLLTNHRNAYRKQLAFVGNELATLLIEKRQYKKAAKVLKHCSFLSPNNLSVLLNRYHLVKDRGIYPVSRKSIELKLAEYPPDRELLNTSVAQLQNQSGTLANTEIFEFAKKRFWTKSNLFKNLSVNQMAVDLDPLVELRNKKQLLYGSISRKTAANEYKEAESQLNILLDFDDSDHFALIHKAKVAILRENLPEAGLWMDLAKEAGVSPEKLLWHKAAVLKLRNKTDEALRMLNDVIPDHPGNADLWSLLAQILLENKNFQELQDRVYPALKNTLSKHENYMFYVVRGYILKQRGENQLNATRKAFVRALELNPDLPEIRRELLELDMKLGVPAFMEEDAKNVLLESPENPMANNLMGQVRLRRNQPELARDYFVRSLKSEKTAAGLRGLAETLLLTKDSRLAESYISEAIKLDPDNIQTLHVKTKIALTLNKTGEAEKAFRKVYESKPDDPSIRLTMIRLLIQQGKLEDAAMRVSNMLEKEDYLPRPVVREVKKLARILSQEFQNKNRKQNDS
ncbi:MAG: DUF2723 domain-containing protein [Kiritimatiellia bacterium]